MDSEAKEVSLEIDVPLCTGCRSCELACSFHLEGICDPAISKVKITRGNETGEVFCDLPLSCPECSFEVKPRCVEACAGSALIVKG